MSKIISSTQQMLKTFSNHQHIQSYMPTLKNSALSGAAFGLAAGTTNALVGPSRELTESVKTITQATAVCSAAGVAATMGFGLLSKSPFATFAGVASAVFHSRVTRNDSDNGSDNKNSCSR